MTKIVTWLRVKYSKYKIKLKDVKQLYFGTNYLLRFPDCNRKQSKMNIRNIHVQVYISIYHLPLHIYNSDFLMCTQRLAACNKGEPTKLQRF